MCSLFRCWPLSLLPWPRRVFLVEFKFSLSVRNVVFVLVFFRGVVFLFLLVFLGTEIVVFFWLVPLQIKGIKLR